jgi:hypothetical protein
MRRLLLISMAAILAAAPAVSFAQYGGGGGGGRGGRGGGGGGRGGAPLAGTGSYTVKLTVNGKSYTRPLTVRADPRER